MTKIKNIALTGWVWILLILVYSCQSPKRDHAPAAAGSYYTCSMHPQIHKDKPGTCPICGMKLIQVDRQVDTNQQAPPLDTALSYLTEPVTQTVVGSFKVITPIARRMQDTLIVEGRVDFDQRDIRTVSSRVAGRIDRLYVKYSGQLIQKGDPLMAIYSPELVSAQRALLQTVGENDPSLISPLKEKLQNLGMSTQEIQKVIQSGHPISRIMIYSPSQGVSRPPDPSSSGKTTGERLPFLTGMYVHAGQTVFAVQDIRHRWAMLQLFAADIPYIHRGDPVELYADANPAQRVKGQVDFIPAYRDLGDKTTTIRVYLNSLPATWKIGTLIHGQLIIPAGQGEVYVPLSAINQLGTRTVVWVKDKHQTDVFHATEVQTGIRKQDWVEIRSGIEPGDQIVENAAYMVDSDSFVQ